MRRQTRWWCWANGPFFSLVLVGVAASSVVYVGGCSSAAPEVKVKLSDLASEREKLEGDIKSFQLSTAAKYADLEHRVAAFKERLSSYQQQATHLNAENAQLDAILFEANPKRIIKVPDVGSATENSGKSKDQASKGGLPPGQNKSGTDSANPNGEQGPGGKTETKGVENKESPTPEKSDPKPSEKAKGSLSVLEWFFNLSKPRN